MITPVRPTIMHSLHPFGFYTRSFSCCLGTILYGNDDRDQGKRKVKTMIPPIYLMNSITLPPTCLILKNSLYRNRAFSLLTYSKRICLRTFSHIAISHEGDAKKEGELKTIHRDDKISRKDQLKSVAQKGSTAVRKGAMSLREILKKYGWTFAGTYFTIWIITLSIVFGSIDSGYVDPVTLTDKIHAIWSNIGDFMASTDPNTTTDIMSSNPRENPITIENGPEDEQSSARNTVEMLASKLELWDRTAPYATIVRENPHVGNFAIAVVITKLTEVVRIPLALAIVPKISKVLGQKIDDDDDENEEDYNKSEKKKD